jgi:hypothetical protein
VNQLEAGHAPEGEPGLQSIEKERDHRHWRDNVRRAPYRVGLVAAGAGALTAVELIDPAHSNVFPSCIFRSITGLECPGCGSTRALHQLLNGDVLHAFNLNPLALIALPWLLWRLSLWLTGRVSARPPANPRWLAALAVLVLTYGVLRNVPVEPFTFLSSAR